MNKVPDMETQEFLFYENVKNFKEISEDIAHYNRLAENSGGDRCFQFLFDSCQRYLMINRQTKMRNEITKSLGGNSAPAAPAVKGGGKRSNSNDSKSTSSSFS
jgi:hypothetical protein